MRHTFATPETATDPPSVAITSAAEARGEPTRRPVNARSIAIGLLGVVLISAFTAFNDFVLANTYLIGNLLPISLMLFMLMLVILVNAPLHRFKPRWAMSGGELSVITCMIMISCAVPSSGLMRYLQPQLVGVWFPAKSEPSLARLLDGLALPDALFPDFPGKSAVERSSDPVVEHYWGRVPGQDSFWSRWNAVPWHAWIRPALAWGVLVIGVFGAVLCLAIIVRRQWSENERLVFPLALAYLSLIEPPQPGRALNPLLRSRGFWVAFAVVMAIHLINGLHQYDSKLWPLIPVRYDLNNVLMDPPFVWLDSGVKTATIYFCVVGLTYFLPSNLALSMWFFMALMQPVRMVLGSQQREITMAMAQDQTFGIAVTFCLMIFWVGRQHWMMVFRQMLRGRAKGEPEGLYLSYRLAGWGLVGCIGLAIGWLCWAGMTVVGAVVAIGMILMLYLVVARVAAETGLLFVQVPVNAFRPWIFALSELPSSLATRTTMKNCFFTLMLSGGFVHDQRESIAGFAPQAFQVADKGAYPEARCWRRTFPLLVCLVLALVVSYVVGGAGMLYTEYSYAATADNRHLSPINSYAIDNLSRSSVLGGLQSYESPLGPRDSHSRWQHFSLGATVTAVLAALRMRFMQWPLHPIGYLLVYSYPMRQMWFSILLGWIAKTIITRLGGASLFRSARPVFLGLVLGEAAVAAGWLLVSLVRYAGGLDFHAVNLLPT